MAKLKSSLDSCTVATIARLSLSQMITGFVTRVTWRVPLMEQELFILPDHLNFTPVFSGVHVTRSLVYRLLFVLLSIVLSVLRQGLSGPYQISPLVSSNSSYLKLKKLGGKVFHRPWFVNEHDVSPVFDTRNTMCDNSGANLLIFVARMHFFSFLTINCFVNLLESQKGMNCDPVVVDLFLYYNLNL